MPPTVTSWGEWIGGLWPDGCWRREWIAAWAAIGWHAANDTAVWEAWHQKLMDERRGKRKRAKP